MSSLRMPAGKSGGDPGHHRHGDTLLSQALARAGTSGCRGWVVVIHDLGIALHGFRRLILVHQGRLVADRAPVEVLSVETVQRVFGVQARIHQDEAGATPVLWFPL
jgi:ABC-type hemin transport system ATPase subunit